MSQTNLRKPLLPALSLLAFLCLTCVGTAAAKDRKCDDNVTAADRYTVRSLEVASRWKPKDFDIKKLETKVNDPYLPSKLAKDQDTVRDTFDPERHDDALAVDVGVLGAVAVYSVNICVTRDDTARAVDILIRPTYLRLDIYKAGRNFIPIPRTSVASFYDNVPAPLRAFNPKFGVEQDREYGFAPSFKASTDLLQLGPLWRGEQKLERPTSLEFSAEGRKSVNENFYNARAGLALSHTRIGAPLERLALRAAFAADMEPRSGEKYARNSVELGGEMTLRPDSETFNSLAFAGSYRWSRNRLSGGGQTPANALPLGATENALALRAATDGHLAGGAMRTAAWAEVASPEGGPGTYKRLAGLFGYQKELGGGHQTVGVEILLGAGRTWGAAPRYALFYGGKAGSNFLYEDFDDESAWKFPVGPIVRSLGAGAGDASAGGAGLGGRSYAHLNLNVTVPIPKLSRPLIPDLIVFNKPPRDVTLSEVIKKQVKSAEGLLSAALQEKEGLDAATADARAAKIMATEAMPAVNFLADKANVIAVKPLFMLDVARLNRAEAAGVLGRDPTRVAVGGGVQAVIVVTKFEIGYMRTVRGLAGDRRGDIVARIIFDNFF